MMVESGFRRAVAVFLLAPAGQCGQQYVFQARLLPHAACDLVAIHPSHSNVKEHLFRTKAFVISIAAEPL